MRKQIYIILDDMKNKLNEIAPLENFEIIKKVYDIEAGAKIYYIFIVYLLDPTISISFYIIEGKKSKCLTSDMEQKFNRFIKTLYERINNICNGI